MHGKRILVIDGESLITADLARSLSELGADIVGPVGDLRRGEELARQSALDAAILDINLERAASYSVADILT